MIADIETYLDLLNALSDMTHEQLSQPVQIADSPSCLSDITELKRGIAFGSVADFEFYGTRSVVDNKYHAEEIVLLIDSNPFAEDGALAYEMKSEGPEHGNAVDLMIPIYGKGGKTLQSEQFAPNPESMNEFPAHVAKVVEQRHFDMDIERQGDSPERI